VADSSNPWWNLLVEAVKKAGGKLGKPEIFPASTDARYFRELGIPAFGFSPMANTPILLHDHNEVNSFFHSSGPTFCITYSISCNLFIPQN
jgi:acetylornithine deacetylase/succinyl-diaminopimelate desuccinylase-like protein